MSFENEQYPIEWKSIKRCIKQRDITSIAETRLNPPHAAEEWWVVNHTTQEFFVHHTGTMTYRRIRMCASLNELSNDVDTNNNLMWRNHDFIVWYDVTRSENRTSYNIVNFYSNRFNEDNDDETKLTRMYRLHPGYADEDDEDDEYESETAFMHIPSMYRDYTVCDNDRQDYIRQMTAQK